MHSFTFGNRVALPFSDRAIVLLKSKIAHDICVLPIEMATHPLNM